GSHPSPKCSRGSAMTYPLIPDAELRDAARVSKAWPNEEARKLLKRYPQGKLTKDGQDAPILLETGYGPSGLPHIGKCKAVQHAKIMSPDYDVMNDRPTRIISYSEDMYRLHKVTDNVHNQSMLAKHLDKPLTQVPNPFCIYEIFA